MDFKDTKLFLFDFGDTLLRTVAFDIEKGQVALYKELAIENQLAALKQIQGETEFLFGERDRCSPEIDVAKHLRLCLNLCGVYPQFTNFELELMFRKG